MASVEANPSFNLGKIASTSQIALPFGSINAYNVKTSTLGLNGWARTELVTVFFYGSFMSSKALRDGGLTREILPLEVATLEGFDLALSPSATLVPSTKGIVYGVIAELTQAELDLLYAPDWLKDYKPRSVIVTRDNHGEVAAVCYIASPRLNAPTKPEYVARLIDTAKNHGFPSWYIERLRKAGEGLRSEERTV